MLIRTRLNLTKGFNRAVSMAGTLAFLSTLGTSFTTLSLSFPQAAQAKNMLALSKGTSGTTVSKSGATAESRFKSAEGSGTLVAMMSSGKELGQCALKHTDVSCDISGYVARVTVKQTFHNPFKDKIEALYTFPLSDQGAVDEMLMKVGDRTIHGTIKKREEARAIYEQARANGQVASLLDQERTNIFTQSVANIEPGKEIEITIKYVETLPFENGKYSFAFPTVVGPRFMPGNASGGGATGGTGRIPNTDQVPDASRITPPVAAQGERAGHDLSINVHLNSGMAMSDLNSQLHQVNIESKGTNQANVCLVGKNTIPNKDFVLSWNVAQDDLKSGYLTYKDPQNKEGFFTLMLVPPKRVTEKQIAPKEMIFVIDCSGSQSGPPLDKCKETMNYILDHMNADDTFQIIAFSDNTRTFADHPQKVSAAMKDRAHAFISSLQANGGTWMAPAVEAACKIPADGHRLRIVTFMTDGYVGNDFEITGMVKKLRGVSRWFPFGTGNSVNRMLIDGIAKQGGGEPDYVLLNTSGEAAGKKFYDRISTPVLTDVKIAFDGVKVKDVFPKEVSDVWAEKPLYFKGKYTAGGAGTVTLSGYSGGKPYEQKIAVNFPENNPANPGIASLWARAKVDRLMDEDLAGAQQGSVNKELKEEIVATALAHHIMTQYTSFVAVDEKTVTKNGKLETVTVPVEVPDGVSREMTVGKDAEQAPMRRTRGNHAPMVKGGMVAGGGGAGGYYARFPFAKQASGNGFAANGAPMQMAAAPASPSYSMARVRGGIIPSPVPQSSDKPMGGSYGKGLSLSAGDSLASGPAREEGRAQSELKSSISHQKYKEWKGNEGRQWMNSRNKIEISEKSDLDNAKKAEKPGVNEPTTKAPATSKLSQSAQALLKNNALEIKGLTRKGDRVMVVLKTQSLTAKQKATLKKLGLEIATGSEKAGEIKGLIKINKLIDLANLDFVLSILLDSDLK